MLEIAQSLSVWPVVTSSRNTGFFLSSALSLISHWSHHAALLSALLPAAPPTLARGAARPRRTRRLCVAPGCDARRAAAVAAAAAGVASTLRARRGVSKTHKVLLLPLPLPLPSPWLVLGTARPRRTRRCCWRCKCRHCSLHLWVSRGGDAARAAAVASAAAGIVAILKAWRGAATTHKELLLPLPLPARPPRFLSGAGRRHHTSRRCCRYSCRRRDRRWRS